MSDYLSNLLARSFNQTEMLQPRLASLFESLSTAGETITESSLELESQSRELQLPQTEPSPSVPTLATSSPPQSVRPDLPPIPTQVVAEDVLVSQISIEQQPTPEPTNPQIAIYQVTGSLESRPFADSQSLPLATQRQSLDSTPPVIPTQLVPLSAPATTAIPSIKPEPPTIRVTIGRIDVRAIASPTPPRQAPKPNIPKLSLEDYLKSRNGGKG